MFVCKNNISTYKVNIANLYLFIQQNQQLNLLYKLGQNSIILCQALICMHNTYITIHINNMQLFFIFPLDKMNMFLYKPALRTF